MTISECDLDELLGRGALITLTEFKFMTLLFTSFQVYYPIDYLVLNSLPYQSFKFITWTSCWGAVRCPGWFRA